MVEACGNCRYWLISTGDKSLGSCRRYPPGTRCHELMTERQDWCGEHRYRSNVVPPAPPPFKVDAPDTSARSNQP